MIALMQIVEYIISGSRAVADDIICSTFGQVTLIGCNHCFGFIFFLIGLHFPFRDILKRETKQS